MKPKVKHVFRIKRVYDGLSAQDGLRFLVDRLWPRGVKKESLRLAGWLKVIAPSHQLRKWFDHNPAKWTEIRRRYAAESKINSAAWKSLFAALQKVTLLFAARDMEFNHAAVLKQFLIEKQQP